jgi:cold shock protein
VAAFPGLDIRFARDACYTNEIAAPGSVKTTSQDGEDQEGRGTPMATGTIITIRDDKGFGFIAPGGEKGNDVFFHRSAVVDIEFEQLREGQEVSFDEEPDPRNPARQRAVNVRPADGA